MVVPFSKVGYNTMMAEVYVSTNCLHGYDMIVSKRVHSWVQNIYNFAIGGQKYFVLSI